MILASSLSRRGGHGDRAGASGNTTLGLRHKPLANPPPTSQRWLFSAPGGRPSGYPGNAISKRTWTPKVVPFAADSCTPDRSANLLAGVESNLFRIESRWWLSQLG